MRMFLANNWLASWASLPARLPWPMILTPFLVVTTWPSLDSSQLPPASTARSTITEPGLISATMAAVICTGAVRPGMSAVVMTMSCVLMCSLTAAACFFM